LFYFDFEVSCIIVTSCAVQFLTLWLFQQSDVILTAVWRYLPFLFNFEEVLYVQYLYLDFKLCNLIITYNLRNLFLKENKRKFLKEITKYVGICHIFKYWDAREFIFIHLFVNCAKLYVNWKIMKVQIVF